jgi:hypothetical protein
MTRRILVFEPATASPDPGQAPDKRRAGPAPPRPPGGFSPGVFPLGGLPRIVRLPAAGTPAHDAAPDRPDPDAWLKLPRGIAVGLLLAAPFWALLMVWLLW